MNPDPDADLDPAIFVIDLHKMQQKANLKKVFLLITLLFKGTCTSFSKRSHKAVGIKVFITFLFGDRRIQIRIRIHTSD
jgi:hypothetical protein